MKRSKTTSSTNLVRSDYNLLALGMFATALAIGSFMILPGMLQPSYNTVRPVETFPILNDPMPANAEQPEYEEYYYEPQAEDTNFYFQPVEDSY